jgi:hypothetical protein
MTPRDFVMQALRQWSATQSRNNRNCRLPPPLPTDFDLAAEEWMTFYRRQRQPDEAPAKTQWGEIDPYITRLISTLAVFLNLPSDKDRQFVRACIEDGIDYRGEQVPLLRSVYEETMKMREIGKEAYIRQACDHAYRTLGVRIGGSQ